MKTAKKILITTFLLTSLYSAVHAVAPVVDESENFILLDGQPADFDQPRPQKYAAIEDEQALAHDDISSGSRSQSKFSLYNKIQGLQQEVQELRGQLEVQAHELKLLKEQQLAFYKDLDQRMQGAQPSASLGQAAHSSLPASNTPLTAANNTTLNIGGDPHFNKPKEQPISGSSAHIGTLSNPANEQISYMAAYELIKNRQFPEATVAMQDFIKRYPNGGYSANAYYWLGELYLVQKDYVQAVHQFEIVNQQFPNSSKAAASTLKIGYALAASGNKTDAKQKLNDVIKNYPGTTTAQLAAAKLKSL